MKNFLLLRNNKIKVFPPQNFFFTFHIAKKVLNDVDGTTILHSQYYPPLSADFPSKFYYHIFRCKLNLFY